MSINTPKGVDNSPERLNTEAEARRNFLMKAGKFAAVTPPAITLLLGTSLSSRAIAKSSGSHPKYPRPGYGWGDKNHLHYGPPGQLKKLVKLDLDFWNHKK
ncbi:hypothetical protein [Ensifer sesbaniae]|uniref:hypothetical protein n=1 Tax=Ensifer sesbaniae TaxID=1214071 RepID=UPI003D7F38C7